MNLDGERERFGPFLELICPNGGEGEQQKLREVLEESGGLPELALLVAVTASVFAVEDDLGELIEQLRRVGAGWEANLLSASDSLEEDAVLFELTADELLALAARELSGYELQLWQIDDPRLCAGFIAREADADLVRKNAGLLRLRIAPVAGLV